MPQTIENILANDYVTQTAIKKIDHGLKKPRPGGHTIVRELQRDLLKEQDDIHGGSRANKWASSNPLLSTSDLYAEMTTPSGLVAAVRSDIVDEVSNMKVVDGKVYTERFFSTRVTFSIDVGGILSSMGEFDSEIHRQTSAFLSEDAEGLRRYIETNGAETLLDRWLPAERYDTGYNLSWNVADTYYRAVNHVELIVDVRERHLVEGFDSAE